MPVGTLLRHVTHCAEARGFTLAELVIVLLLLGILAAVALPRFATPSDFAVQGTFDQALASVRYAQKVAIASRAAVRVTFDGQTLVACHEVAGACTANVRDPVRNADLQVGGADVVISGTTFTYDGLGRPAPGPVTVSVTGGGVTRAFTVEAETGHAHP